MKNSPIDILAVDDEDGDLDLLKAGLRAPEFKVVPASSLAEARRRLAAGSFQVLIVDLNLPDGDGLDLLVAACEKDPHTVAIVLTGHSSMKTAVASLRRGAYDYLIKPCPMDLLTASVRRAVEKYRLTHALAQRTAEIESINRTLDRRVQDATQEIFLLNERLQRSIGQLIKTNESQAEFMDNTIHELKNPLSVVRGYLAYFLEHSDNISKEDFQRALRSMDRNAEVLNALLEELMEATRLTEHKIELRPQSLDAYQEVHEAVEAYRLQARDKGLTLISAGPHEQGPALRADKLRLRQVLSNLLSNALKFTPAGGRVTVWAKPSGASVHFCVEDTGIGIPDEHLGRIFDRFYQTESHPVHKGLGLGLEITKGLVHLHGGRIWAESEPGEGSKFHFTLPLAGAPAVDEAAQAKPAPQRSQAAHPRPLEVPPITIKPSLS